jgi:hypothetical protein
MTIQSEKALEDFLAHGGTLWTGSAPGPGGQVERFCTVHPAEKALTSDLAELMEALARLEAAGVAVRSEVKRARNEPVSLTKWRASVPRGRN